MNERSDEQLMAQFCDGDDSAFQVLYSKYRDRIYRFVLRTYNLDAGRAEDCTQETFLKVIRKRQSFASDKSFSAWLYAIARHHCLNDLRRTANQAVTDDSEIEIAVSDHAGKQLLSQELEAVIREAVASLPESLREVFMLREVDGLPHGQVAAILGLEAGAVRTRVHRAKQQLQQRLNRFLED